jgi:gamma-glutamyltranspeptidase/glutathione hydrolase
MRFMLALVLAAALAGCATPAPSAEEARTGGGMVAAANPLAVEAGLKVLRAGGSAVDAAIAVQATLGLV